jgi:hypothetical protein
MNAKGYASHLVKIFKRAPDKHEAHRRSVALLADMSGDPALVTSALAAYLRQPGVLNTRNYPVVGIPVALNEWFDLVLHGWIARPDRSAKISSKAIHHHGELLLTSATVSGSGYEHWLFTRPRPLDPTRGLFKIDVTSRQWHPAHHLVFVDAHTPHMPWSPPDTTVTLCLWSDQRPTTWRDRVKRIPALKKNEYKLRALAARLGITRFVVRVLGVKVLEALDYYPADDGFRVLPERQEFDKGPNEDHLHSLFHLLQHTNNEGLGRLIEERMAAEAQLESRATLMRLLSALKKGEPIEGRLSACHLQVPHVLFAQDEVERALVAQGRS